MRKKHNRRDQNSVRGAALNLQEIKLARKGGGNCKEKKCKERPQNSQPCEFATNGICKECVSYSLLTDYFVSISSVCGNIRLTISVYIM